ncbi:DUF6461 domain-containing protein [Nocardioides sp. STR2]|uniref:DUF6461 domain-containing protein n=1 Tax=Nocardioides pini TaxID=2975053 RepID=A0ABT4C8T7_9ACTN|nr:DUF6461 domain-containing protein [Nocardioides pini]MCY4725365.1 DUF6461 domain-containing protein [Nocardioides pini]
MTHLGSIILAGVLAAGSWLVAPSAGAQAVDDGFGDADVARAAYDWLGPDMPNDTYAITLVTGRSVRSVLRVLAPRRSLGPRTPGDAAAYFFDRMDRYYSGPHVVQVAEHGPGVVVIDVSGFPTDRELARLGRHGTASSFSTTVELDTYVTVARHGRVVRQFDTGFRPPREGALPQEAGLGFGRRGVDPFSPAWALNERLTRIHVSKDWFFAEHPTYVLPGRV